MGHCKSYNIECPFALQSENAPVPCVGSQGQCDKVRGVESKAKEAESEYWPYMGGLC
jgi:hypothetical protein